MSDEPDLALSGCLSRLDSLLGAVDRLQRAHALRLSNPANERVYQEVCLAKAAIDADYQILKIKLTQTRDALAPRDHSKPKPRRPRNTKPISN